SIRRCSPRSAAPGCTAAASTKPCSRAAPRSPERPSTTWTRSTTAARSSRSGPCRSVWTTRRTPLPRGCSKWSTSCCRRRSWSSRGWACRRDPCGSPPPVPRSWSLTKSPRGSVIEHNVDSHPEGWALRNTTLKRRVARALLHSAVPGPRLSVGTTTAILMLVLSALLPVHLSAQTDLDRLALRFASMTAVTGLEQAMVDSLRALFPGSTRDQVGNVTLTLGQGSPKRLCTCPLDEVGYVAGNILPDGFVLLRRVGGGGGGVGG